MSYNYKQYGQHRTRKGREPQPWNSSCVLDIKPPREGIYDRLLELAEGWMRKGFSEDYAMEKAAHELDKHDELYS